MPILVAAVVLVGLLGLANLLLLSAVLRRLREHSERFARLDDGAPPAFRDGLVGGTVPDFTATTVTGDPVTGAELRGRHRIVGFLSAGCEPCHEQAPGFARWASVQGGSAATVAVVTGTGPEAEELVALLRDRAAVVAEPDATAVADVFGVTGFPTFLGVDTDGVITGADTEPRAVTPVAADLTRA